MEQLDQLLKTTLTEVERILSTKTIVGEPFEVRGNTIVPLVSVGFGFGGGGGAGEDPKAANAKGSGLGTGGGGGVKPVAVIIADKDGHVRLESILPAASIVDKVGEAVARVMDSRGRSGPKAEDAKKAEAS